MERYTQARDLAAEAQSQLYPQIGAGGELSDNRQSVNRLFRGSTTTPNIEASNEVLASASWEPDFWDQIRNLAHERKRLAQASAAELATARLSLQTDLATDYLAVRGVDQELEVLRQAIVAYQKAVEVKMCIRDRGTTARGTNQVQTGQDHGRPLAGARRNAGRVETRS